MNAFNRILQWFAPRLFSAPADGVDALTYPTVKILEENIQEAIRSLKRQLKNGLFRQHKPPCVLVIGAENTGKTSLLALSELGLLPANNKQLQTIVPTAYCNWLFNKSAVFVDVSGGLMVPNSTEHQAAYLWKKFLGLLQRHYRRSVADGLVICMDLMEFQYQTFKQRRQHIDTLRHHIQALPTGVPVYLAFTRCDHIKGFTEFFATLSTEERKQICGITLPAIAQQDFSQQLEQQFNTFLQRINQQVFTRLHYEHLLEKRILIKDFPLQLEAQKISILQIASQLHSSTHPVQGVYLTSSQQDGAHNDALAPALDVFGLSEKSRHKLLPSRASSFFIKHMLEKIILHTADTVKKDAGWMVKFAQRYFGIAMTVLITVAVSLVSGYWNSQKTVQHFDETLIKQVTVSSTAGVAPTLYQLNTLYSLDQTIDDTTNLFGRLLFWQTRDLHSNVSQTYQHALQTQLTTYIQQVLEAKLQNDGLTSLQDQFDALRIYLMLKEPQRLDKTFVRNWFADYTKSQWPGNLQQQQLFSIHLNNWLTNDVAHFPAKDSLIAAVRATLGSLSLSELVYLHLQEELLTTSATQNATASEALYAVKNFNTVHNREIPKFAQQVLQNGSWALNLQLPNNLSQAILLQLIIDVQHLYEKRYAAFWLNRLTQVQIPTFKSLEEAYAFSSTLNTANSPLFTTLTMLEKNLQPVSDTTAGQQALAIAAQQRDLLLNTDPKNVSVQALQGLNDYLNTILKAPDSNQAALTAAQQRMSSNGKDAISQLIVAAKSAPAPLNQWLNSVAVNSWQAVLQTARKQLNALWLTQVIPAYNEQVKNRYPVFKDSKNDMAISNFVHFFGHNGTLDQFFQQNLAAFADTSSLYWRWKSVDGTQISIPQSTLEMFNRVALIRKMFFADQKNIPAVKFSLIPVDAELLADNYTLSINGQQVQYGRDFRQNKTFQWPSINNTTIASFSKPHGESDRVYLQEMGDWAVFRLFDDATIASSQNTQLYQLTFNVDNKEVSYELLADQPVNPFIPDFISAFRSPEQL